MEVKEINESTSRDLYAKAFPELDLPDAPKNTPEEIKEQASQPINLDAVEAGVIAQNQLEGSMDGKSWVFDTQNAIVASNNFEDFFNEEASGIASNSIEKSIGQVTGAYNSLTGNAEDVQRLRDETGLANHFIDKNPEFARKLKEKTAFVDTLNLMKTDTRLYDNTIEYIMQMGDNVDKVVFARDEWIYNLEREMTEGSGNYADELSHAPLLRDIEAGRIKRQIDSEIARINSKRLNGETLTDEDMRMRDALENISEMQNVVDANRSFVGDLLRATGQNLVGSLQDAATGAVKHGGLYALGIVPVTTTAGAVIGSFAPGAGTAAGALSGAAYGLKLSGGTGALTEMYYQSAGEILSALDKERDAEGNKIPEEVKLNIARFAAIPFTALDYIGLKQLGMVFPGIEKWLTKETATATVEYLSRNPTLMAKFGEAAMRSAQGMAGEIITEVAQDRVTDAAVEAGRRISGLNKEAKSVSEMLSDAWETTKETAKATAIPMLGGGAIRVNSGVQNQYRLEDAMAYGNQVTQNITETLRNVAVNSPTFNGGSQTANANAREFIRQLGENGVMPERAYIDAGVAQQIFTQTDDDAMLQIAESLGITEAAIAESLESGTDISVDVDALVASPLMRDDALFNQIAPSLKYDPEMFSANDLAEMEERISNQDYQTQAVNDMLDMVTEEENNAQDRIEDRRNAVRPLIDQMLGAGMREIEANATADVAARMFEPLAKLFGKNLSEFSRGITISPLTPEQMTRIRNSNDLAELFNDQAMAEVLESFGITKGMSKLQQRMVIDPFVKAAYGRTDYNSFKERFGKEAVREINKIYGFGFWAKKDVVGRSNGKSWDMVAREAYEESIDSPMYAGDTTGNIELDYDEFWDKVMRPHDEVIRNFTNGLTSQYEVESQDNVLAQNDENQGYVGEFSGYIYREDIGRYVWQFAKRKEDTSLATIVNAEAGEIPNFKGEGSIGKLVKWLGGYFKTPSRVIINANDGVIGITDSGIRASVKKTKIGNHREAYGPLKQLIKNAEYSHFEPADEKHRGKVKGQDVYHAALRLWDGAKSKLYSVEFRFDVPLDFEANNRRNLGERKIEDGRYYDHDLRQILIAPAMFNAPAAQNEAFSGTTQNRTSIADASEVTLGVLRGNVNASGVVSGIVYQKSDNINKARGAMRKLADGQYLIGLFRKKNASTAIHELSHVWLDVVREAAKTENAPTHIMETWADIQKALGFDGFLEGEENTKEWTRVQETWARQFEAYLMDGKAPAWELQAAFNLFRHWMTEIYRSIKNLFVKAGIIDGVNEDLRVVFDNLLATQDEIDASQRSMDRNSVMDILGEEIDQSTKDKYLREVEKAKRKAEQVVANRHLVELRLAEETLRSQIQQEIDSDPFYSGLNTLRERGINFEAFRDLINEDLAYELQDKWKATRNTDGTVVGSLFKRNEGISSLEEIAEILGVDSIDEAIYMLQERPTRNGAIEQAASQALEEWKAQNSPEFDYAAEFDEALKIELEALTGQQQVEGAVLREAIERRLSEKSIDEVMSDIAQLIKVAREEEGRVRKLAREVKRETIAKKQALLEGFEHTESVPIKKHLKEIARLKERQRIRIARIKAGYKIKTEKNAIVHSIRSLMKRKDIPVEFRQQMQGLLTRFRGVGTKAMRLDEATLRSLPALNTFLVQYIPETMNMTEDQVQTVIDTIVPPFLVNGTGKASKLTIGQMRQLRDTMKKIAHIGKISNKMMVAGKLLEVDAIAEECAAPMDTLVGTEFYSERDGLKRTFFGAVRGALASMTAKRFIQRMCDGYQKFGPNYKNWFQALQNAQSQEQLLSRTFYDELNKIMRPFHKQWMAEKPFKINGVTLRENVAKEWGGLWDKEKVFCVALNMGNAGNLKALMRGYGWTENDLQTIASQLTEAEWNAVQKIWDTLDKLYAPLNSAYMELVGSPLRRVSAQPITVTSKDGKTVSLNGGYYPLKFNTKFSDKAKELEALNDATNSMFNIFNLSAEPVSGMTQERTGGTLPPLLSLQVVSKHVFDTIHYATHAVPLRNAMQLFKNQKFKDAFIRAVGQEEYDALNPWLKQLARPQTEKLQGVLKALEYLGKHGTMFALGANMKTMFMQTMSLGNSFNEVGRANYARACMQMIKVGPLEMYRTIAAKSAYMQNRVNMRDDTFKQFLDEMRRNDIAGVRIGKMATALDLVREYSFAHISGMDMLVALPTWQAEYEKSINNGMSEDDAVAAADGAVVSAQGGGGALDTPLVMQNAAFMRCMFPFMTFALSDFNRKLYYSRGTIERFRGGEGSGIEYGEAAWHFALEWVAPVIGTVMLLSLARDGELPETEDFVWEAATFWTMGIPIARDLAKYAEAEAGHGYSGHTPLYLSGIANGVKGAKYLKEYVFDDKEKSGYKAMKAITNSIGFALGLGTPQIWRTVEGSQAYFIDGKGTIMSPLLGKPQEKKEKK